MSDVRKLRIEIGAAINSSVNSAIRNVQQMQRQLARETVREQKKAADEAKQALKRSVQDQQSTLKSLDAWQKKALKDRTNDEKRAAKESTDVAKKKASEIKRLEEDVNRTVRQQLAEKRRMERAAMAEVERDLREHNRRTERQRRETDREGGGGRGRGGGGFGGRFLSTLAMRGASAAMNVPMRMAGALAGGLGIDMSMEGQVSSFVERQRLAANISNQAYNPNIKGMEKRVDPKDIMRDVTNTAIDTGTDSTEILEGLSKFVSHTGDLATIRETMGDLAKLTKANGANFGDMAQAMGEVANEMGDIPNKGKEIQAVLRSVAGMGQMTSIEIKDVARNMATVAGQAGFFKIDPRNAATLSKAGISSDVGQKIAVVTALAEVARSKGGRRTAPMAMKSAASFIADMSNPNQLKHWNAMGISSYSDAGHTQVRDPMQMLLEAFRKGRSKGGVSQDTINNLFTKQDSRAVAKGFAQDYNLEYEKAARSGVTDELERHRIAAERVTENFDKLLGATQSAKQIDESFTIAMQTAESQVKKFHAQIQKSSDELMLKLIPALTKLAPLFVSLADTLIDKLGIKADLASKDAHTVDINAVNASAIAGRAASDAMRIDPKTGRMQGVTITEGTEAKFGQAKSDIEKKIAETRAELDKKGKERYGLFGGKNYENMTDDQIREQASKTLFGHDQRGEEVIQERARLKELRDTLENLNTSLSRLDDARGFGAVTTVPTPVAIVEDHSKKPGVQPKTSGVEDADSATSHE